MFKTKRNIVAQIVLCTIAYIARVYMVIAFQSVQPPLMPTTLAQSRERERDTRQFRRFVKHIASHKNECEHKNFMHFETKTQVDNKKRGKYYANCVKMLEFMRFNSFCVHEHEDFGLLDQNRLDSITRPFGRRISIAYPLSKIHSAAACFAHQPVEFIFQLHSFYDSVIISCCVLFSFQNSE